MAATTKRMTLRVAVLGVVLAVLLAALPGTIGPAQVRASTTCSIGTPVDFEASLKRSVAVSQVLFVGTVTRERTIGNGWSESVVRPDAVLRGDVPAQGVVIPFLGQLGADCSGGPHLREGERVLLPIYWGRPSYGDGTNAWQLTGIFSKVLIEDGEAILESELGRHPLGDIETVIRTYGSAVGAGETQIQAAIAAANASIPPGAQDAPAAPPQATAANNSGGTDWTWPIIAVLAVTAALAALIVSGMRTRTRRG